MTSATDLVVLATDGTAASAGALRYACHEAAARGADLNIVHVAPVEAPALPLQGLVPLEAEHHGHAVLERAVHRAVREVPDLNVTSTMSHDTRVHGIVRAATGAQLLVLGRETRHGVERFVTGATTSAVAAHAPCPVVVVPPDWVPREGRPRVVVGVGEPHGAADLLTAAQDWALTRDGEVSLIHAWELPDSYLDRLEERYHGTEHDEAGHQVLHDAVTEWQENDRGVQRTSRVVHGQPAAVLAHAAQDADLLMLRRSHAHRPWDRLGATVRTLLRECTVPVEVVPAGTSALGPDMELEDAGILGG
jgi:nucleotide-binding universal stress UspA family protein